jgi:hypothetical protein
MAFKRHCQQKTPDLESGGSADRLETNFSGIPIQKLTKKDFSHKNSKFHPICMKFISKVKNNVSNEIQVDF